MLMDHDEKNGLVKVTWQKIRKRVLKVEPTFAKLVDKLDPDNSFPLFIAYYPYGAIDADTQSTLFPTSKGDYYRLSDPNVPQDVLTHLGYSINNTPLGMVLDKQIECFVDLKNRGISIPSFIYTPGKIFPFTRMVNKKNRRIYAPYGLLHSTAGARSAFMLPNIGCETHHAALKRDFKIKTSALDRHNIIQSSSQIPDVDSRFSYNVTQNNSLKTGFACDGPFVRGCIRISN